MTALETLSVLASEILCASLFYGCFVRAVRSSSEHVIFEVRMAFNLLAAASLWGMVAPLFGHVPDAGELLMLGSIAYTQHITTRHWEEDVPPRFRKRPYRRRRDDEEFLTSRMHKS
jgi:hypothetical protein